MIGRVLKRSNDHAGLLRYLYSPGRACGRSSPHLVACWRHPAELEPPLRPDGKRDFRYLTGLLAQPLAGLGDRAPAKPVYHCEVRTAPGDPKLGDDARMRIACHILPPQQLAGHCRRPVAGRRADRSATPADGRAELADLGNGGDHVCNGPVGEADIAVRDVAGEADEVSGRQVHRFARRAGPQLACDDV